MGDGYPIVLRRHGNPDGLRLVVSHGNGFAVDAYWPFWARFIDGFDVFVHDIRNHGWNPVGDPEAHSIPMLAEDFARISREIDQCFGAKPKVGVFHSLSALTMLHSRVSHEYAALVLFDPPLRIPGSVMDELERLGSRMGAVTRRRQERFDTPDGVRGASVEKGCIRRSGRGQAQPPRTRHAPAPAADGDGYELRCPREHEARLWDSLYPFARTVDFDTIACPIKVVGSDPTVPSSFLPSTEMSELMRLDYDFVPETTHLLQLERPETCAAFTVEYLATIGLNRVR